MRHNAGHRYYIRCGLFSRTHN